MEALDALLDARPRGKWRRTKTVQALWAPANMVGTIRRQVCCERRHKGESIPIGQGNVELAISSEFPSGYIPGSARTPLGQTR